MLTAGIAAGMLPLIHTHTLLVVITVALFESIVFRKLWREWLKFFLIAAAISAPQLIWLIHGSSANLKVFFAWHVGWDHGQTNVVSFWLINTGVFIPLLLLALYESRKGGVHGPAIGRFYLPFLLCLIVPNLIQLAPWIWDNIKVLFYWYLASVPLVAGLLAKWFQSSSRQRQWAAALLLFSLTLSGALDILRVLGHAEEYREFDNDGINIASVISQETPPRAVVLHAPTYNSPVFLTGRRSLLGFPGWAWSRGLDPSKRQADIIRMYEGAAEAQTLLKKYDVDYVLVGPQEREAVAVNTSYWDNYPVVGTVGEYRLYRVSPSDR
jgi:hypothetical protein